MTIDTIADNGPILAVIGGRFLPVNSIHAEIDRDTDTVRTVSGTPVTQTVGRTLSLKIETKRPPKFVPPRKTDCTRLYNREYEYRIDEAMLTSVYSLNNSGIYQIEMECRGCESMKRRP